MADSQGEGMVQKAIPAGGIVAGFLSIGIGIGLTGLITMFMLNGMLSGSSALGFGKFATVIIFVSVLLAVLVLGPAISALSSAVVTHGESRKYAVATGAGGSLVGYPIYSIIALLAFFLPVAGIKGAGNFLGPMLVTVFLGLIAAVITGALGGLAGAWFGAHGEAA